MTAATRPLFPEGVEVHQADLQRAVDLTELRSNTADTARVYRGSTEVFQGGVLRGLRITRNSTTTTRFDVSSGAARTAGGYHIEVDAAVLATELSDPTDGIENFVCLVYTETDGTPRPHETANTNQNTVATPSYRVVALTEAAYNALPWSDDDYSINARDRIALLGSVFGNGSGVALVSAEIQQQDLATERIGVKYTVDDADGVLNGVNLVSVTDLAEPAPFTAGLSAQIKLTVTSATNKTLAWHEEGTASYGTASASVHATTGAVTLTGPAGSVLTVYVQPDLLPDDTTSSPYECDLTVTRLYDATGPRWSPADVSLREMQGQAAPNEGNPNGVSLLDIAQSFLNFTRSMALGSDLTTYDRDLDIPRLLTAVHSQADIGDAKLLLWEAQTPVSTIGRARLYYDGKTKGLEATLNARYANVTAEYVADTNTGAGYCLRLRMLGDVDAGASVSAMALDISTSATLPTWATLWSTDVTGATTPALLALGADYFATSGSGEVPRLRADAPASNPLTYVRFPVFASQYASGSVYNFGLYRVVTTSSTLSRGSIELCFNLEWDHANTRWTKASGTAAKLELANDKLALYMTSAASPVTDASLASGQVLALDFTTGVMTVSGTVTAGSALTAAGATNQETPRFAMTAVDAASGADARWLVMELPITSQGSLRHYLYYDGTNYRFEKTLNAYWDVAAQKWTADVSAGGDTATIWRDGTDGTTAQIKTATLGTPWADNAWDATHWTLDVNGGSSVINSDLAVSGQLGAGSLALSSDAPDPLGVADQDVLYADQIVRGWVKVVVALGSPAVITSFTQNVGVTIVTVVPAQTYRGHSGTVTSVRITLDQTFSELIPFGLCWAVTGNSGSPATLNVQLETVATSGNTIDVYDLNGDDPSDVAGASWTSDANTTETTFYIGWVGRY